VPNYLKNKRTVLYTLDQNSKIPLHIQLYNELKNDIISEYKINDKLPSIRKIASTYNLSKTTVESAYSQLVAEGYIDSFPKSGYFVVDTLISNFPQQKNINQTQDIKKEYRFDLHPARLEKGLFPIKLWKRLFNKEIDENIDMGRYSDPQGEYDLRDEIAKYLQSSRAVKCEADQVVVCNGFADGMNLIARMFNSKKDPFTLEDPGYYIAYKVFDAYGYDIQKLPIDKNGIILKNLEKLDTKLLYITPSHQYPTGATIPIANRQKLLSWAKQSDTYIIEDDYDSELNYSNRPIPSLQGLDNDEKVIYVGTFAKSLSPALRVSYVVFPWHLIDTYKKQYDDIKVSLITQKTLKAFMKEGHWEKFLRKVRTINKKKHDLLKELLLTKLKDTVKIESIGAGLTIHINPNVPFDMEKFKQKAEQNSIKLYFAKTTSGGTWDAIRLGFGGFSLEDIVLFMDIFEVIWYESIIK
jgi:GntR family transcriptional regulator/MocR family aminotransferase